MKNTQRIRGFTLVEIAVSIALIGLVLLAFAGMATVVQRGAGRTQELVDAQQNARSALDFITENLRAAGSDIAAYEGQTTIVHAGPYQVAFNADLDHGEVIDGDQPMSAINSAMSPPSVPASGTTIYSPGKTFNSGAETVVLTLDSNPDGVVGPADRGDEAEENGRNTHVYLLKRYLYGYVTGAANEVRDASVALVRGPVAYANGDNPAPLFEYYYNGDDDITTPDLLWGDDDANGTLDTGEIAALDDVPDSLLNVVRMVKVNVISEGGAIAPTGEDNDGFVSVVMSSRVWIRNVDIRESARVYGVVYYDANKNAVRDTGEPGISKVKITLSGSGRKTTTDQYGNYNIPVSSGTYTAVETDPTGYTSTTPNSVALTVVPGEKYKVDFGDATTAKFGYIVGTVWDDVDLDAAKDASELGIPGVTVQLQNDMSASTNADGYYRLTVPVGSYTVKEYDLDGYTSTTPNSVSASLAAQGDSVVVNFGDALGDNNGTLAGHVYEDEDQDAQRDFGEPGLVGVSISLSNGATALTDADGYYEFSLDPGKYDAYELDPENYTSTTPNLVGDIWIATDTLVTLDFGDIPIKDLDFVEILVSDTDRPLSLAVGDLREDIRRDVDIVLGTPTSGGSGNMFFYINEWTSTSTPVSALFNTTPTSVRSAGTDVNAIELIVMNVDKYLDVLSGQESFSGNNVLQWLNDRNQGQVGNSPDRMFTSGSSSATTRFRIADVDGDGNSDLLVGHKSQLAPFTGGFEVFGQYAVGSFTSLQTVTTNGMGTPLGVVTALAAEDLDNDGDRDIVLGANQGNYWGHIDLFYNDGNGAFTWQHRYLAKAGVNDIAVVDLMNDIDNLPDILVGISEAQNVGGVQVWLNKGGVFGVNDTSGFVYDADTEAKVPDDYYDAGGEALALAAARLDADIFPELLIGTRSSIFYTGDLLLVRDINGTTDVTNIKVNIAGEVVTIDFADFNKDSNTDIAVTTRTSANSGKLAIYFLDDPSVVP